ncbi:MAG: putative toxin-antitoxin system toxin component, PIN family [Nitrospinae bacterium RIFCSPHIGHO2_12_FULL_39_42]|nr:MAG: putative toxin-antitoxin system toxin component, PIN family [Nitrospinae bacterium RIFCSPHIGHO2_12_FULL_39_42]
MFIKAVIDTNIWISALINPFGYPAKLRKHFENGDFAAVISEPILDEIVDVLSRPKIKDKYEITPEDIRELLTLIEERAEYVLISGDINICRDKDDNLIIETAIKGETSYLVTRDDDIKFDKKVSLFLSQHGISVLTVAKFLKLM